MFFSSYVKARVALVGATGVVGRTALKLMMEHADLWEVSLFASKQCTLDLEGRLLNVHPLDQADFSCFDVCMFATEENVSKRWIESALHAGARVVDSSSWRRLDPSVPLVVPGVNQQILQKEHSLCAHSNCIVSPLACVLAPLNVLYGLKCIHIATYQSVSGAGKYGVEACLMETKKKLSGTPLETSYFPKNIGFNVIPQIGQLDHMGHSSEEEKIQKELHRILQVDCPIFSTAVRVPVLQGHASAVWVEFQRPWSKEEVQEAWCKAPHIEVAREYQTPLELQGRDVVSVGRVRQLTPFHLAVWVCSDNLLRGAASDMVDIAKIMVQQKN
ncbi:aspartate-semialdehyde dehydrogenase [Holospora curviuscula]|uniref:Aspartate-semialdehyde dehydrogenase 2 n=1 Tax=Holospora curviuscula TaxID=1082868 RepID=A0A2S5R8U4_9PROT|nr:aspartate-semialdehyde dehydrogenase [Holospora curviuscula]PPE03602.1 Aspartate-semialdehyde dehydrogenase 2 [Holospora curviuscula]